MELAINLAAERGASEVVILGGSGSRLDHTLANIMLLSNLLNRGIKGCLEDANNRIYLIRDRIAVKKQDNRKVSLLSLSPAVEGLTTKGLEYKLENAVLKFGSSFGISNEFIEETAEITIKKGLLLVFVSKD
jgi:thiamine pyrophosphokinase